jgi:DNA-binding CsgD family transcriptional regulator/ArsR family metal-binding transcriptional regulator
VERETPFMQMDPITKERHSAEKDHGFSETVAPEFLFHGLRVYFRGPTFKPGGLSEKDMAASFLLNICVSPLFPYLNAVAERAELHRTPQFIRFIYENRLCVLYSQAGLVTPVDDRDQARSFLDRLMAFLNDIYTRRREITPNHRLHRRVSVLDILKLLPNNNCGQCGHASCMAFAAALSIQESVPEKCPHMRSPLEERAFYPVYDAEGNLVSTVAININTAKTGLSQNESEAPSHPESTTPPEMDPESAETANMALPTPLSARELEVLCILAEGTSNNEISHMLNISPHTVKSHIIHIFNKLGVNDRTQAAVWAARHHLI